MKRFKLLALLLVIVMMFSIAFVGCTQKTSNENQTVDQSAKQTEAPKDNTPKETAKPAYTGPKVLDYYVGTEPQTLDAQQMWGAPDMFIANMFIEGLLRLGQKQGVVVPGVAESWKFDSATATWTFKLNPKAVWMDGTPITATDFFFAWRMAIDTQAAYSFFITDFVKGASDYAALTKDVYLTEKDPAFKKLLDKNATLSKDATKNAEAIKTVKKDIADRKDKMTDAEKTEYKTKKDELWSKSSAIAADNGMTLSVTLGKPCPFFEQLAAFPVFFPANEKFYNEHSQKGDYTTEAIGLNSNGPWKVQDWKHKDSFKMVRNDKYWNNANIKIDELNIKIVEDVETRTNLLKTGKLDGSAIQAKDLPDFQDVATLDKYGLQTLIDLPDYTIFYVEFNHFSNKIIQNINVRKALSYAMDRKGLVEKISLGDDPGVAFIPNYFPGIAKSFREENGKTLVEDNNKAKAKEFLTKALEELKLKELPAIDMLIDTSDIASKIAQKFQSDWSEIGIKVNLVPLPWSEKLTRLQKGEFAMCSSGWGPDYLDAMTYLDLFETTNGSNSGLYSNPAYDKLINDAKAEFDAKKRIDLMYQAEKMLIDQMVVAPEYFRIAHWTYKKYLTGVVNRGVGASTDFYYADIDMSAKMGQSK